MCYDDEEVVIEVDKHLLEDISDGDDIGRVEESGSDDSSVDIPLCTFQNPLPTISHHGESSARILQPLVALRSVIVAMSVASGILSRHSTPAKVSSSKVANRIESWEIRLQSVGMQLQRQQEQRVEDIRAAIDADLGRDLAWKIQLDQREGEWVQRIRSVRQYHREKRAMKEKEYAQEVGGLQEEIERLRTENQVLKGKQNVAPTSPTSTLSTGSRKRKSPDSDSSQETEITIPDEVVSKKPRRGSV